MHLVGAQVNTGLVKMYQAEVLSKVPIMQHHLFGNLLPFPEAASKDLPAAGGDSPATAHALKE